MASLTTAMFLGVPTVFTLPPFFFSAEPVASQFLTQVLMAWADGTARLWWIPELFPKFTLSDHKTVTVFCRTLSQQKHVVLQSTAPLQIKRFKVGSKMAIASFAPVLPNQKKTVLQNRPIHWRTLYTAQTVYTVYTRISYRIVPVTSLNKYLHYDTNGTE